MDGSKGSDGRTRGSGSPGEERAHAEAPDLAALARDWIELWQSEVTALAADPETAETWARLASLWAGAAASGLAAMPRGVAGEHGFPFQPAWQQAWAPPPPRPAAPAAAPDAGGDAPRGGAERAAAEPLLERVLDRLEAIERRLAALEQRGLDERGGAGAGGQDRRRPRGRRG
ncbi:MAG: hypothetical protein MUC89_23595 [Acetobacteraceae bacterium]|jgi:hypothetical protein|nr:hypothetical protein [Acetobacteraceae bacterium]